MGGGLGGTIDTFLKSAGREVVVQKELAGRAAGVFVVGCGNVGVRHIAVPAGHQLLQPFDQALAVTAVAVQHALHAVFLARHGPLAAASLEATQQAFHHLGECFGLRAGAVGALLQALDLAQRVVPSGFAHADLQVLPQLSVRHAQGQ